MLEKLESGLKIFCRPEGGSLVVGLSGGPDSICLLYGLHRLGYTVTAAHLDHALRPESAGDAEVVRRIAEQLGIPVRIERRPVALYAHAKRQSIEEAARTVRYRFLFETAVETGAIGVTVGHTADDQVETVLMHLLRGAGLSGLGGMPEYSLPNPWSRAVPLLRPLIGVWRSEIETYIAENELHPVHDASNQDRRFYRNRLRHDTLPYLESLNPGFRRRLWQTAELLRQDEALIEAAVDAAWQACLLTPEVPLSLPPGEKRGETFVSLHSSRLRQYPLAIQRRLLRRAAAQLRPGLRDIDFAAIQRGLDFLNSPPVSNQADWIAGLRLVFEGDRLWIAAWEADLPNFTEEPGVESWPQLQPGATLALQAPGELSLPDGWQLRAEPIENTPEVRGRALDNSDPYQAWLDLDTLTLPLTVSTRGPGDRFRPLGMGGHSLKLSDFLINTGMPRRARAGWPLVASAGEIVWIPGYRIGQRFALSEGSRRVLLMKLSRMENAGSGL